MYTLTITQTHLLTYIHIYIDKRLHAYTCKYIHTYIHAYAHLHSDYPTLTKIDELKYRKNTKIQTHKRTGKRMNSQTYGQT